jgi:hypothetical protein
MAEALLRTALPPPDLDGSGFDWESWLVKGARGIRRMALSRRDGGLLLMASQPSRAHYAKGMTAMVKTLCRTGLAETEARQTLLTLGRFAIGWAAQEMQAGGRRDDDGFEFGLGMFVVGLRGTVASSQPVRARARTRR